MPPTKKFPVKGIVIKKCDNRVGITWNRGCFTCWTSNSYVEFKQSSHCKTKGNDYFLWPDKRIPVAGDRVEFIVSKRLNKQGQAQSIETIELLSHGDVQDNGKELCPHCGKRVNPRMTFYRGAPCASYCPLCGGKIKQFMKVNNAIFWITVVLICSIFVLIPVSQILS